MDIYLSNLLQTVIEFFHKRFSHPDNATICYLFISYFLSLTSIFTFFFFGEIRNLTTFCLLPLVNNGFSLSSFFLSLLSFLWIGAQFPQEKFLSYGRILTLHYYFLLMCILFSFFGSDNRSLSSKRHPSVISFSIDCYSIICEPSSCWTKEPSISSWFHSSCACLLHPKSRNQGKGMLEVPWLAVELREWFASHRLTFPCSSIIILPPLVMSLGLITWCHISLAYEPRIDRAMVISQL